MFLWKVRISKWLSAEQTGTKNNFDGEHDFRPFDFGHLLADNMLELCPKAPTMRTMWNQIQMHWRCCWSIDRPWIKALASVLAPCPSNGVDLPGSLDPQDVEVKKRPKESLSWISFHRDRGNHAAQDTERMVRLVGQFRPNFLPSKLLRGASDSAIFFS